MDEVQCVCVPCYVERERQWRQQKKLEDQLMEDEMITESRRGKVVVMSDRSNINWRLSKIPAELHPVVNSIALGLAHTLNWDCGADLGVANSDIDFVNSSDHRAIRFARLALVAMSELQDFCMDNWGTSLEELIDKGDE